MGEKYFLLCEDCGRVEKEPHDVGDTCICGGIFIEVDKETAAHMAASYDADEAYANGDWNPD